MTLMSSRLPLARVLLASLFIAALALTSFQARAALTLQFDMGNGGSLSPCTTGSCFVLSTTGLPVPLIQNIESLNGIVIGTTQIASGGHDGPVDGTENPNIDKAFTFSNYAGMHKSVSPTSILSQSGNTMELDFSGWRLDWWDYPDVIITGDGSATVTCDLNCAVGESYTLTYAGVLSNVHPAFDSYNYNLTLRGTVVPLPASAWLLLSGLTGMAAAARRSRNKPTE